MIGWLFFLLKKLDLKIEAALCKCCYWKEEKKFLRRWHHIVAFNRSFHSNVHRSNITAPLLLSRINLLFKLWAGLPFIAICMFWGALHVLAGDLRLSRFVSSTQEPAEEVILLSGKVLIESFAEDFNFLEGPQCPAVWGVFPTDFPAPCVESTLLSDAAGGLDSFTVPFRRSLFIFSLWCRGRLAVLDSEALWSGSSSVVTLELLGCDRLKGIGLVHGFFFLALPCRNGAHNA